MRAVPLRPAVLLVLLLGALGGWTATASASDAGLRGLVSQQRAAEKRTVSRLDAAGGRIGTLRSYAEYRRRLARYTRSYADILRQDARVSDRYRARFRGERAQTSKGREGRLLMIAGLRDSAAASRFSARRLRAVERQARRVSSPSGARRLSRAFDRALTSRAAARSNRALKRGRTLIRHAPKVRTPTPTAPPSSPAPSFPSPPASTTPAPTTTTPSSPSTSLIPGVL